MPRYLNTLVFLVAFVCLSSLDCHAGENTDDAIQAYVLDKLISHDIVMFGTTHRQPVILGTVNDLLFKLTDAGVTYLGLEIPSDQQDIIDRYLVQAASLAEITLHQAVDCPEYRHMLAVISRLPVSKRPVVRAIDLPVEMYDTSTGRDEWMAEQIVRMVRQKPEAKILVILGNLHVLRSLDWQPSISNRPPTIRTCLKRQQPGLSVFSILNIIGNRGQNCDFSRHFGGLSGAVAIELDSTFQNWTLGLTRVLAVQSNAPGQLAEGLIVY
jgi:hypothetical protein